jgi:hypothetical protein
MMGMGSQGGSRGLNALFGMGGAGGFFMRG